MGFLERALCLVWSIWLYFAAGEMRLVYSRWLITAITWKCCQVGCQSMDCLWMACLSAPGQGAFQRAFMDWPSYASGCCASALAWSNPIKEGCFFFKDVYGKPLCFPAGIQTIHRKGLGFFILSSACPHVPCLHGLLVLIILCLKW